MKILVLLQREWAFLYGIHIIEAIKKKYPEARFAGYVYKISTWKKIKEKYNYFDHLWLGYKYDDNINNTEIRDQFKNYDIESIEDELGCQVFESFVIDEPAGSDIEIVSSGSITCLEGFTVSAISSFSISGEWGHDYDPDDTIEFDDPDDNTTDVQVSDFGEYTIWFEDDDCEERIYFTFEMESVKPVILADPYVQYCENEVTLLEADSDVDYGVWTLISPSPNELDANNTEVDIDAGKINLN